MEEPGRGLDPIPLWLVSYLQNRGMQHGNVQMMSHDRLMTEGETVKKVKLEERLKL